MLFERAEHLRDTPFTPVFSVLKKWERADMKRIYQALTLVSLAVFATPAFAQQPRDTLQVLLRAYSEMTRATRTIPIWPGFRPDTIPWLAPRLDRKAGLWHPVAHVRNLADGDSN